ncbi:MAG TPA: hypothetical protein VM847_07100 [Tahibacter sp.]|nr:hypothetical protein [Tahibacter sp.]
MTFQTLVKVALVLFVVLGASSCATGNAVRERAVDRLLEMCALLSEPGIESKADGEVTFWYESERVRISRELWNLAGVRALQARLARPPAGDDEKCLRRALREALGREAE